MEAEIKLFGQKIKEFRKKNGYTQEKLAEMIDVDYQTISRIETGYYFTSFENLTKLAKALNVTVEYLVTGENANKKSVSSKKNIEDELLSLSPQTKHFIETVIHLFTSYEGK